MEITTELLIILSLLCTVNAVLQIILLTRKGRKKDSSRDMLEINQMISSSIETFRASIENRFDAMDSKNNQFREAQLSSLDKIRNENTRQMDAILQRSDKLTEAVDRNMQNLRKENTEQLDRMRKTVDEQLKDTLESRLAQSFEQVQKQLESVYKGLGEMQNLAKSVGDLSKIFSNVKARGVWGEVQAASILDEILTPDQYVRNFRPKPKFRLTRNSPRRITRTM